MKLDRVIHPELLSVLAEAGHGDTIVLADAGLKIPASARRLDLGVTCGVPTMLQVLEAVLSELVVEAAIVADEFAAWNPEVHAQVADALPVVAGTSPHLQLMTDAAASAYIYIKTGECTAYSSVVLVAGVSYMQSALDLYESIHGELPQ